MLTEAERKKLKPFMRQLLIVCWRKKCASPQKNRYKTGNFFLRAEAERSRLLETFQRDLVFFDKPDWRLFFS
ncbi:hypothetical protein I5080_08625 [Salmonella enterica]|nr:hypothetical protein I5080_08625 [Salmonella enterica]